MSTGRTIRVVLPTHLRTLANTEREVPVRVDGEVTLLAVIRALEAMHPPLAGTILDRNTGKRRALVRFFACQEDWSHEPLDAPLPEAVCDGGEPLTVLGAIAGG